MKITKAFSGLFDLRYIEKAINIYELFIQRACVYAYACAEIYFLICYVVCGLT